MRRARRDLGALDETRSRAGTPTLIGTKISAQDAINDLNHVLAVLSGRSEKVRSRIKDKNTDKGRETRNFVLGEEIAKRTGGFTFGTSAWLRSHSRVRRGQGGCYMNGRSADYDFVKRQEKAIEYGNTNLRRKGKPIATPRAYNSPKSDAPQKQAWNTLQSENKITDHLGNVKFRDTTIKKGQCGCYMVRSIVACCQ